MVLSVFDYNIFEDVLKRNFDGEKTIFTKQEVLFVLNEMSNTDKYYNIKQKIFSKYKVFKYFMRYLLYSNLANYDSLVLICGEKGTGKSSFAMMMAREWCKLLGIPFSVKKHIAYTNRQVQDKIESLPKFSPIICDEAINFCTTENWNKSENKDLKIKLGQVRTKHMLYILCMPLKIVKVDSTYRQNFVNYWIELFGRGIGAIFVKDKNPVADVWRVKEFQRIGSYTEFTSLIRVRKALMRHPNFWYMITCPRPPEILYKQYLEHREENVYREAGVLESVTRQDVYRAVLIKVLQDIMVRDSSLSMKRLLLHIKNEYNIDLREADLKSIIQDSEMLLTHLKEENKNIFTLQEEFTKPEEQTNVQQ